MYPSWPSSVIAVLQLTVSISIVAVIFASSLAQSSPLSTLQNPQPYPSSLLTRPGPNLNTNAPVCDSAFGTPNFDDCNGAIATFPNEPSTRPVLRNFYVADADRSTTMWNVLLPYSMSYGTCNILILLATEFIDVPHDQAKWSDLWLSARTIRTQCVQRRGTGGIITKNGRSQNLEVVMYSSRSLFAYSQILKHSTDPVARSIATQELLDLMGFTPRPTTDQIAAKVALLAANQTTSADAKVAAIQTLADNHQGNASQLSVPGGLTNVTGGVRNTLS